jgi:DNA-binding NarL/FixJ family response regulator
LEARDAVAHSLPDLVVLDPARNGGLDLGLLRAVLAGALQAQVVVYTGTVSVEGYRAAVALGVTGYLLKRPAPPATLADLLVTIARTGHLVVDPLVVAGVRRQWVAQRSAAPVLPPVELAPRERHLPACLAAGQEGTALAGELGLSRRTVYRLMRDLHYKLGTATPFQLGVAVKERGLL